MVEHEFSRIWVSKVIESRRPFRIQNPLLSSVVKFGLVPSLALGVIYATRHEHITSTFLIAYFAILVWLNIGPYLIWYYNRRLQPGFFREANDMVSDSYKLNLLAMKYERLFSRRYWLFSLLGAVAFVALYAISLSVLTTEGGIQGLGSLSSCHGSVGCAWRNRLFGSLINNTYHT